MKKHILGLFKSKLSNPEACAIGGSAMCNLYIKSLAYLCIVHNLDNVHLSLKI